MLLLIGIPMILKTNLQHQARHAAMNQNVTGDDGEARKSNDGDDMENEGAGSLLTSGTNDEPVRDCCNPGK